MTTVGAPTDVVATSSKTSTRSTARWMREFSVPRIISLICLGTLIIYPLGWVVVAAFIKQGAPLPGIGSDFSFTLGHFHEAIVGHASVTALRNSITIAILATLLATVAGVGLAWLAARTDVPMPRLAAFSGIVPLLVPALVGAVGWAMLGAKGTGYIPLFLSWIGLDFGFNIYSYAGIVFVYAVYHVPLTFVLCYGALRLANPEMEDAANVHGATKWMTLRMVTAPMIKPAILSSMLLNFVQIVEDFPVAMVLGYSNGIETLAARIYVTTGQAPPPNNLNAAHGVLLTVIVIALVIYQRRMLKGQNFATVSGKGLRHRLVELGPVGRWVALFAVVGYIVTSVGLPFAALLMGSLRPSLYTASFPDLFDPQFLTLEPLKTALTDERLWQAARNSLIISLSVALVGLALAVLVAYASRDQTSRVARVITQIVMLPVAIPGVVMGLALLWAYVTLPITIYGTMAIMVVAIVSRLTPTSHSSVSSALNSIHPDLEDAASVSGAGRLRALRFTTLPLMRAGLASTGVMLFILATREVSASVFLYTPQNMTFSVYLFQLWGNGSWNRLASMSLIFAVFTFCFVFLARRWITDSPTGTVSKRGLARLRWRR